MAVTTGVRRGSDILNNQIKIDFDAFKQSLEKLTSLPDIHSYSLQIAVQIENLLLGLNETADLVVKSERLLKASDLSLQLSEFLNKNQSHRAIEFSELTKFLGRRAEVYAVVLLAFKVMLEAETDRSLSVPEQFRKYASAFELLASNIESRWQFMSTEVLKQIEVSADAALNIELKNRQEYDPSHNAEFAEIAKAMRRSVASVLWMIDKLEDSKKVEGFKSIKNSLTPFMKHLAVNQEEQIEKNKGAITLAKKYINESQVNQATEEEIEEYWEIQKILKRDE
jgi:hypothetical protein